MPLGGKGSIGKKATTDNMTMKDFKKFMDWHEKKKLTELVGGKRSSGPAEKKAPIIVPKKMAKK